MRVAERRLSLRRPVSARTRSRWQPCCAVLCYRESDSVSVDGSQELLSCCPPGHREWRGRLRRYTRWMTHGRRNIVSQIRRGVRIGWQPGLTGLSTRKRFIFFPFSSSLFLRLAVRWSRRASGPCRRFGDHKEDSGPTD